MFPTNQLRDKHILVGISGGIAAYKIIELIRYLVTRGARVYPVMTAAAEKFITRLTLETLAQQPVAAEMFPAGKFAGTHHIHQADRMDAAILAPATYNLIGKIYGGIADDFLTTTVAALHCPVVLAPAMNVHMWENPILQRNIQGLAELGYLICPPEAGFLAEGYSGMGRLAPTHHLIQYLYRAIHPEKNSLSGRKVLITAGPTEEPLDPVRFLSNRSSGKMGFALAWEAFARGAEVTLIHGPVTLPLPAGMRLIGVRTAEEMWQAVRQHFPQTDIYLSAAAIADYTPAQYSAGKIKKTEGIFELPLKRTTDILAEVGRMKQPNQRMVGFAVETDSPEENARRKLEKKNLDMIVLNNPLEKGAGFREDTNRVTLISRDASPLRLGLLPKLDTAFEIVNYLIRNMVK